MRNTILGILVPLVLSGWPVFRFLGWVGLLAYWVGGGAVCVVGVRLFRAYPPEAWLSARNATIAVILVLVLYSVAFSAVYPLADSGRLGGGSDRDNALTQATSRLLHGESPYREPTYLGRPISPLPGGLILSIPWVRFFGNAAYQNLLWLCVLFILLSRTCRSEPMAALVFVLLTAGSPAVQHEFLTGGDLLANSIAVTFVVVVGGGGGTWTRGWRMGLLAVFAGLVFAWRANFLLALPLVGRRMAQRTGRREAALFCGVSLLISAAAVLPVWLWDPAHFTPIRTYREIGYLDGIVPHFGQGVVATMAAATLVFALRRDFSDWVRHAALVQMIPIFAGGVLVGSRCFWCSLSFLQFGLAPLFLWVAGSLVREKVEGGPLRRPSEPLPTVTS